MGLPGDLGTVVLTGRFLDPAGNPMRGTVTIQPNATLTDATGTVIIPQLQRAYQLFNGTFTTAPLVGTDNTDINPSGWTYLITIALQEVPSYQFNVALPSSGSPVDLSTLSPAQSIPELAGSLLVTGGTLTGKLTLTGSPPLQIPGGAASGDVLTSDSSGNASWAALLAPVAPAPTGVAATDTAALTSALSALSAGQRLTFQGPGGGPGYVINAPLTPPSGVTLVAGRGCTITQNTQFKPVFDLFNVNNVTIGDGFTLINGSGPPGSTGSSFRGDSGYCYSAGVWANGSGITVGNARIRDFAMGVYLNASNGTVNTTGTLQTGNIIGDLEISGCNHGVLYLSQQGLRIGNLYVHDHVDSSGGGNPTHAIYGTGNSTFTSTDISVGNCLDVSNPAGVAYQFKFVNGLNFGRLRADTTLGLVNILDCFDVTGADLKSVADQSTGASFTIQKSTTQPARITLGCVTLTYAVDASSPSVVLIADDVSISQLVVNAVHNGANVNSLEVSLRGNRITLSGVKLRNTGSSNCRAIGIGASGYTTSDATISDMEIDGYRNLVDIDPSATGQNVIDYAPAAQRRIHFGSSSYIAATSGTPPFIISRRECTNTYAVQSGSTTPFPLPAMETVTRLSVNDSSNFTIQAPVIGLYAGLTHEIAIYNGSGGAMGTISWNAVYSLRSTLTAPASGDTVALQFMYDGTHWREVDRTVLPGLPLTGGTLSGTLVLAGTPALQIAASAASGDVLTSDGSGNAAWATGPGSGTLTPTATKTANYTATAGDMVKTDTSGGSLTVTLPSPVSVNAAVGVKQIAVAGAGTNATTIACGGSDVFNKSGGSTSMTLDRLNQTVIMQYGSGGIWTVQSTDPATGQIATARQGVYYLDTYTGTDDAKMSAALAALFAASPAGGTIVLSPRAHTFANQWTTSYSAGVATAVKIQGAGAAYNGAWGTPTAATTVTFTYSSTGVACMDFQHIGSIEITGIQFKSANVGVPFFFSSNASPNVHDNVWSGGATGASCATDAIILGGTTGSVGSGDTDAYQGYAGGVYRNFFDGIRRIVKLQTFANAVQIHSNTVSSTCGTNLSQGGCIETGPVASQSVAGVAVYGNCFEMTHYPYGIKAVSTTESTFGPNGFFDASATCLAMVYLDINSQYNEVVGGFHSDSFPFVYDVGGTSTVRTTHQTAYSVYPQPAFFTARSAASSAARFLQTSTFPGPVTVDNNGDQAGWSVTTSVNPFPQANVWVVPGTQVTDGATYLASAMVTSLTAGWTSADLGVAISGTGIPSNSTVQAVFTHTTAIPWAASWAYSLGDIGRPTSGNSHLYQVTTAGTSSSSQPTWPTGGGTVTDGTAVWTDLGTSATAVAASRAATATGTAITVSFGRIGTPITMTGFNRHHVLSTGAAPTVAVQTAQAGSGATASVTGFDMAFNVQVTTGTGPAAGNLAIVTTANPANWSAAPKVSLTPKNAASAALGAYMTNTTSGWTLAAANTPAASTLYSFDVISIQ